MGIEWGGHEPRNIDPADLHTGNLSLAEQAMVNMGRAAFRLQDSLGLLEHDPSIEETAARGVKLYEGLKIATITTIAAVALDKYGLVR